MATEPLASIARPSSAFVLIACKHPAGVLLNLDKTVPLGPNGMVRVEKGRSFALKGWAHPKGTPDPAEPTGGYAFTQVPADFWEAWIATHKDFPMLADKTILPPHRDAPTQAKDHLAVGKMFSPVGAKYNDRDGDTAGTEALKKDD